MAWYTIKGKRSFVFELSANRIMDFTHPNNSQKRSLDKRVLFRRIGFAIALFCVTLLLLIGFAPLLLSTAFAREKIVAAINATLPSGTLTINAWSFAWCQNQTISGIAYTDSERHLTASIQEVRLSSLWRLLPLGKIKADITIDSPTFNVPLLPFSASTSPDTAPQTEDQTAVIPPKTPFVLPAWDITLHFNMTNAHVTCPQLSQPLLQKGNLSITLPSLDDPIQTTLSALLLDVSTTANATFAPAKTILTSGITPHLLREADLILDAPWIKSKLTATAKHPNSLPETMFLFSINAGRAFTLLRPLNLLPDDLNSASGHLSLSATLKATDQDNHLQAACTITGKELSCDYNGKNITCSPTLSTQLTFDPKAPLAATLQQLQIKAPGVSLEGRGSLTNGLLQGDFYSAPFWEAFTPFLGDYPLKHPLHATIELRALRQTLSATLTLLNAQTSIAEATLKVDDFNPQAQTFRELKLNTACSIAPLTALLKSFPKTATASGEFYANLAATGSLKAFSANTTFALQNASLKTTSWNIAEPILFKGQTALTLNGSALSCTALELTSPIATLTGDIQADLTPAHPFTANIKGTITPTKMLKTWRIWGKDEKPITTDGTITYTLSAEKPADSTTLTAAISSDSLTLLPNATDTIPLPFTLNATLQHTTPSLRLNQMTFTTPALTIDSTGTFDTATGDLALNGSLTPDFDTLFQIVPALKKQCDTFAVSGKQTRHFTFKAPITQGLSGILNYGKAEASLGFDTVTVPGLEIPQGEATFKLHEGVAAIDGEAQVNGGTVSLKPRLNLSGKTPILTWEPNAKVLHHVQLTQHLFDTALGSVNPILTGSAQPSGSISLTCDALYLPLTDNLLRDLEMSLVLNTHDCQLKPNGATQKVLSIIAKQDKSLRLEDQHFAVNVTDGSLKTDPIHIRVEDLSIACQGETNLLTQAINYTLTIPLTEKLIGKSLAKSVKPGETVTMPITGTLQKPVLDTAPLVRVFTDAAVNKAKTKLATKLERALQKRVEKQNKRTVAPSSSPSPQRSADPLEEALRNLLGN